MQKKLFIQLMYVNPNYFQSKYLSYWFIQMSKIDFQWESSVRNDFARTKWGKIICGWCHYMYDMWKFNENPISSNHRIYIRYYIKYRTNSDRVRRQLILINLCMKINWFIKPLTNSFYQQKKLIKLRENFSKCEWEGRKKVFFFFENLPKN